MGTPGPGTRLAAVIGSPVRHSRSPAIHNAAFAALGIDACYLAFEVDGSGVAAVVEAMRRLDWLGVNATMPCKDAVARSADRRSPVVERLNAANCLRWDGAAIVAESTDGEGFLRALRADHDLEPDGLDVVVLGAGGAARAVVDALAGGGAASVTVVNRDPGRAIAAAALAGPVGRVGEAADVSDARLVVNATPVGMAPGDPSPVSSDLLRTGQVVVDLLYHPVRTPLLDAARSAGLAHSGGIGMLVHQAAIAFEHWTGRPAPVDVMAAAATS